MNKYIGLSLLALVPFAKTKTIELQHHPDSEFAISQISYEGENKKSYLMIEHVLFNQVQDDGDHKEHKHDASDDYIKFAGNEVKELDMEWLFAVQADNCQIEVEFYDWEDDKHMKEKLDCTAEKDGKMTVQMEKGKYVIDYTVKRLAEPTRFFNLMYIWDVTAPFENDGDELYLKQQITFKGNKYTWKVPKDNHLKAGRTSVMAFQNLYLPCMWGFGIDISLDESDTFGSDKTPVQSIDCLSVELYQSLDFFFDGQGPGHYKVFGKMTDKGEINQATHVDSRVSSDDSNEIKKADATSSKAIKIEYLLNPFHLNDAKGAYDEMNIAIYSDVYEQMFRCGEFKILGGDVIDFNGLVVPCNEFVTVSILEDDLTYQDGKSMLIPCAAQTQTFDYMLNDKHDVGLSIQSQDMYARQMNAFNPKFDTKPINRISSHIFGKNMGNEPGTFKERDAFYQLEVSGMLGSDIQLDPRFNKDDKKQCGGKIINFREVLEKRPEIHKYDGKAPKMVNVKMLYNEFSKKDSKQKIYFQIFSDYLDSVFNSGEYKFTDKTSAYQFDNLFIPCKEHLYIEVLDAESDHAVKNTMMMDCHHNGEQKLSFKLGRFVMDILDEEHKGFTPSEAIYAVEKDGEKKYKDLTLDNGKFVVKEAHSKVFEDDGEDWYKEAGDKKHLYILDVVVMDGELGNKLYSGEKAFEEPKKIAKKKDFKEIDPAKQKPGEGYLSFDNIKVKNLIKDTSKIEVLVHSDLDQDMKWVKILSKSDVKKGTELPIENKSILCTQALVKVVTDQGQHTKIVECSQHGVFTSIEEQNAKEIYKSTTFMPTLIQALTKIVIARDNEGLMNGILEPIKRNSISDVDHYLTNHGSLQRSLTHEMGLLIFDERVVSAFERTNKDMNINTIEIEYHIDSDLKAEVALIKDDQTEMVWNEPIWFKSCITMGAVVVILVFAKVVDYKWKANKGNSDRDNQVALV